MICDVVPLCELDCTMLKLEDTVILQNIGTTHPTTQCHIPEK